MLQHKSIEDMPAPLSLEQFGTLVDEAFFPMACEVSRPGGAGFQGVLRSQRLGQVGLAAVRSTPLDVHRRHSHIAKVTDVVYMVKLQVEGESLIRHRGREAHLQPGDFVLCSSAEPYQLHFPDNYCQVVLAIPANVMGECVRDPARYLGVRMDSRTGANGLFSQFLVSLAGRINTIDGLLAQRLETNVIDLLSTTLDYAQDQRKRDLLNFGLRQEYLQRIRVFIRKHLDDERLGPDWIAERHRISTRYLHMLFTEESMSVSRYIQHLRLEACRSALADSDFSNYSVAEIAYRFGFKDASHFSRVFKSGFGATPARFRRQHHIQPS